MPRPRKRTVAGRVLDVITWLVVIANLIHGPGHTPAALTLYDALLIAAGAKIGVWLYEFKIRQATRDQRTPRPRRWQ